METPSSSETVTSVLFMKNTLGEQKRLCFVMSEKVTQVQPKTQGGVSKMAPMEGQELEAGSAFWPSNTSSIRKLGKIHGLVSVAGELVHLGAKTGRLLPTYPTLCFQHILSHETEKRLTWPPGFFLRTTVFARKRRPVCLPRNGLRS